ncbi:MAG: oligosaccharyl transferase, archaeosortase A system-associated [Haloarculaceae archaeon]
MSQWWNQFDDYRDVEGSESVVARLYHLPVLLLLFAFTLWNRVRSWQAFVNDGQVYFSGNDPWYHFHMTSYTVRHWPKTMPFDPWTYFPYGTHASQFGTIFDQLMATTALLVGLGSPDQHTIALVVLFAPAVIGALLVVPAYFIGRRMGGRVGGLVAAAILVLSSGSALTRGLVGASDHQIVEVLFQSIGVLGVMVAVSVGEREKPVYELFRERAFDALRRPLGWALLAGFGVAAYVWAWPPAVFLIGILGVYFTIELASQHAHGESPEHVAIVGVITLATTAVLTLASFETVNVSPTGFTLLQPGLAAAGAVWFAFLAWFSREWESRDFDPTLYPVGVLGVVVAIVAITAILLPDVFGYFLNQTTRVVGMTGSERAGTIGEAQPIGGASILKRPGQVFSALYNRYGFAVFVAVVTGLYVVYRHFTSRKPRAEVTLVAVWLAFILAAVSTMARFDVYFVMPVAALTSYAVLAIGDIAGLPDLATLDDVETYQILTILTVVLLLFVPVMYPAGGFTTQTRNGGTMVQPPSAVRGTDNWGPGQAIQAWDESLEWMQANTPEEGSFATASQTGKLDYYGTYPMQEDFQYQSGTYGVLSWWDYGHWIETQGRRIPTANPFQKGVTTAANFLVAPNETQANHVLDGLSDGENANTRYVMVDWKLASTYTSVSRAKFFAPATLNSYGTTRTDYSDRIFPLRSNGDIIRTPYGTLHYKRNKPAYYHTMAVRLYRYHGSAVTPSPIVVDWERRQATLPNSGRTIGTLRATPAQSSTVRIFDNMTAARQFVEKDGSAQIGGIGTYPADRVPALKHYRLVQTSNTSASASPRFSLGQQFARSSTGFKGGLHRTTPSWVKVFERVPGATVHGQGPPNAQVVAAVQMRVPNTNSTFVYRQFATTDENGEFTMTLPYSTTDYEKWGTDEGYTSPNVRATGGYTFQTEPMTNQTLTTYRYVGSANVTEGQVIGQDDSPVTVDLQKTVIAQAQGAQQSNQTSDTQSGTNQTSDTQSGSGSNQTATANQTSEALRP